MKMWRIALFVWLILWGLTAMSTFKLDEQNVIMGVLAIAAGVLLAFDK